METIEHQQGWITTRRLITHGFNVHLSQIKTYCWLLADLFDTSHTTIHIHECCCQQ